MKTFMTKFIGVLFCTTALNVFATVEGIPLVEVDREEKPLQPIHTAELSLHSTFVELRAERVLRLQVQDRSQDGCGSITTRSENEEGETLEVIDHRYRICDDFQKHLIQVNLNDERYFVYMPHRCEDGRC